MHGDYRLVPSLSVSRSTALVAVSGLLVVLVLAGHRLAQTGAARAPEVVVQVNGRIRDRLQVSPDLTEEELVALARASERVQSYLDGGDAARTIVVPGRLVNFVT